MITAYRMTIVLEVVVGLVAALAFLGSHRPQQWRRVEAWDASGWIFIVAIWFVRSLWLLIIRWPIPAPISYTDAAVSLGLLAAVDVLLLLRMASYRAFVARDQWMTKNAQPTVPPSGSDTDPGTPNQEKS